MPTTRGTLDRVVKRGLTGRGAHVEAERALAGVDWRLAGERPPGAPHSILELLQHLIYWQEWVIAWLAGEDPATPERAADGWPGAGAPASAGEWERTLRRYQRGLAELERQSRGADPLSKRGDKSRLEMVLTIGTHNSYHLGQVVLLRQQLGIWPPPGGGLTW